MNEKDEIRRKYHKNYLIIIVSFRAWCIHKTISMSERDADNLTSRHY